MCNFTASNLPSAMAIDADTTTVAPKAPIEQKDTTSNDQRIVFDFFDTIFNEKYSHNYEMKTPSLSQICYEAEEAAFRNDDNWRHLIAGIDDVLAEELVEDVVEDVVC